MLAPGIPNPRNSYLVGQAISSLPKTLLTVPAGAVYKLWYAVIQLDFETLGAFTGTTTFDVDIIINGGDTLVSCSVTTALASLHISPGAVSSFLGGRPVSGGSLIQLVGNPLPGNTIARLTGGITYSTT